MVVRVVAVTSVAWVMEEAVVTVAATVCVCVCVRACEQD